MLTRWKAWRKNSRTFGDQILESETATPLGIQGLLVEIRNLFRSIWRAVKIVLIASLVLVIVSFALQLQVSARNTNIKQTQTSAEEARTAAREAKQAVEDAIAQSQQGNGDFDVAKLVAGLEAMGRVEQYVCGGPCPVDEGTEGANN